MIKIHRAGTVESHHVHEVSSTLHEGEFFPIRRKILRADLWNVDGQRVIPIRCKFVYGGLRAKTEEAEASSKIMDTILR
jgi:hypothetical protein